LATLGVVLSLYRKQSIGTVPFSEKMKLPENSFVPLFAALTLEMVFEAIMSPTTFTVAVAEVDLMPCPLVTVPAVTVPMTKIVPAAVKSMPLFPANPDVPPVTLPVTLTVPTPFVIPWANTPEPFPPVPAETFPVTFNVPASLLTAWGPDDAADPPVIFPVIAKVPEDKFLTTQ
jgi:hypothetical protein